MSASNSQIEIKEVSFYVRAGEILGIAGLQGSGSSELLNALFGAYGPLKAGTVMMDGHLVDIPSPRTAIRLGMALLTNDRMGTGLVMEMDVVSNVTLAAVRRLSSHGWLKRQAELQTTKRQSARLRLKALSLRQRVATLSGGNQQKVVFAKWLETSPRVFLLDDPTRGVDIGVKHDIYELMNDLTRSGCGILLVSSELPELLAMSDRILVMHRGRACKEYPRDEATQELILQAALGH